MKRNAWLLPELRGRCPPWQAAQQPRHQRHHHLRAPPCRVTGDQSRSRGDASDMQHIHSGDADKQSSIMHPLTRHPQCCTLASAGCVLIASRTDFRAPSRTAITANLRCRANALIAPQPSACTRKSSVCARIPATTLAKASRMVLCASLSGRGEVAIELDTSCRARNASICDCMHESLLSMLSPRLRTTVDRSNAATCTRTCWPDHALLTR